MAKVFVLAAIAAVTGAGIAYASGNTPNAAAPTAVQQPKICKKVVDNKPGSQPYELCLTKAEWDAKKLADAKDPNRMICHYQEQIGTRFRSAKVCMTAMEWENQRQADRREVERIQMQTCVPGAGC